MIGFNRGVNSMQPFYGTKLVFAEPGEKDGKEGYAVTYADGYKSWSPKDVFEAAYQPMNAMSFGHALMVLKDGKKVARAGWNGKGMYLILVNGTKDAKLTEGTPYAVATGGNIVTINPHIDMMTATGEMQPGWLASQTDMLANDWQLVD
jgi:hypothetical protein